MVNLEEEGGPKVERLRLNVSFQIIYVIRGCSQIMSAATMADEGGGGLRQMLILADKGGRGVRKMLTLADKGWRGFWLIMISLTK